MATVVRVTRSRRNERADDESETHNYRVEFSGTDFTLWEAKTATDGTTSIEDYGDVLMEGSNLVVTSKTASTVAESPKHVDVEVKFTVPTTTVFETQPDGEENWGYSIEVNGVSYTEPVTKDINGLNIASSAGRPLDPSLEKEYFDEEFIWSFNTVAVNHDGIAAARGKINSDTVFLSAQGVSATFAPGTLKMGNVGYAKTVGKDGNNFWRVRVPLLYRADTWKRKVIDQDFYELDGTDLVPILDKDGNQVVTPAFLDGNGAQLASGSDVVLLEFDIDDEAEFGPLLGS